MKIAPLAACLALALPAAALAQASACPKPEAAKAEKAIERVSTWPQMVKAFQDFKQCDTGTVDELYTESLIRLLVEWKNVELLAGAWKDPAFKEFAVKHLRSPQAKDDLETVYSRAKASCSPLLEVFCNELADIVKTAMK